MANEEIEEIVRKALEQRKAYKEAYRKMHSYPRESIEYGMYFILVNSIYGTLNNKGN